MKESKLSYTKIRKYGPGEKYITKIEPQVIFILELSVKRNKITMINAKSNTR